DELCGRLRGKGLEGGCRSFQRYVSEVDGRPEGGDPRDPFSSDRTFGSQTCANVGDAAGRFERVDECIRLRRPGEEQVLRCPNAFVVEDPDHGEASRNSVPKSRKELFEIGHPSTSSRTSRPSLGLNLRFLSFPSRPSKGSEHRALERAAPSSPTRRGEPW